MVCHPFLGASNIAPVRAFCSPALRRARQLSGGCAPARRGRLRAPPPAAARAAREAPPASGGSAASKGGSGGGSAASKGGSGGGSAAQPRVVLKGGKSRLFRDGSPIVYSGAVDRVVGRPPPEAGDPVAVCDGAERLIGWGVFNPHSMFRVRLLELGEALPATGLGEASVLGLLDARVARAVALRRALGLPSADTTVYRLLNSEGDGLSGLVVDVLGDRLVVASSAAWVQRRRLEVEACLRRHSGLSTLMWRPSADMLREEGLQVEGEAPLPPNSGDGAESSSAEGAGAEAGPPGDTAPGGPPEGAVVLEHGLRYLADPLGQKTGYYADQRDSRLVVRRLAEAGAAAGKPPRVLDLCCYSGGFALSAAAGGASEAVGVDSSAAAVGLAAQNAQLNGLQGVASFQRADVVEFMKQARAEGQKYDLIILDPPKLAPNKKALLRATSRYRRLNAAALRLLAPGGLLMTCSCSGAMAQAGGFLPMLQAAAREVGLHIAVLREAGAAPDHPLDPAYPEGRYLTNVLVRAG